MSMCAGQQKGDMLPEEEWAHTPGPTESVSVGAGLGCQPRTSYPNGRQDIDGQSGEPQSLAPSACKAGQQKEGPGRQKMKDCGIQKDIRRRVRS